MDTAKDINSFLFRVDSVLKDVEFDMEWDYHQLLTFSIEWADCCGMVEKLIAHEEKMNDAQKENFASIRTRFRAVADRLKALGLDNPITE